jgi:hypothetical protein
MSFETTTTTKLTQYCTQQKLKMQNTLLDESIQNDDGSSKMYAKNVYVKCIEYTNYFPIVFLRGLEMCCV